MQHDVHGTTAVVATSPDAVGSLPPRLCTVPSEAGQQGTGSTEPTAGSALHLTALQLGSTSALHPAQVLHLAASCGLPTLHMPLPSEQGGAQLLQFAPPLPQLMLQPTTISTSSGQPALLLPQTLPGMGAQQLLPSHTFVLSASQPLEQLLSLVTTNQQNSLSLLQLQAPSLNLQHQQVGGLTLPFQQHPLMTDVLVQHPFLHGNFSLQHLCASLAMQSLPTSMAAPALLPMDVIQNNADISPAVVALAGLAPLNVASLPLSQLMMQPQAAQPETSSKSMGHQTDNGSPTARQQASSSLQGGVGSPCGHTAPPGQDSVHVVHGSVATSPSKVSAAATPSDSPVPQQQAVTRPPGRPPTRTRGQPRKRTRPSHQLSDAERRLEALAEQHQHLQLEHSLALPKALVLTLAVKHRNLEIAILRLLDADATNATSRNARIINNQPRSRAPTTATAGPSAPASQGTEQLGLTLAAGTTAVRPGAAGGQGYHTVSALQMAQPVLTSEQISVFQKRRDAALTLFRDLTDMQDACEDRLRTIISRLILMPNVRSAASPSVPENAMPVDTDDGIAESMCNTQPSPMDALCTALAPQLPEADTTQTPPQAQATTIHASADLKNEECASDPTETYTLQLGVEAPKGVVDPMITRHSAGSVSASAGTVVLLGSSSGGAFTADTPAEATAPAPDPGHPPTIRTPATLTFMDVAAGLPLSALLHSPHTAPEADAEPSGTKHSQANNVSRALATPAASLMSLAIALPLLFLCNPHIVCLMGKLLVPGMAGGDAPQVSAPANHWQRVLALLNLSVLQLRMLSELQMHVHSALQKQMPLLSHWAGCLGRLARLETSKKAQRHLVQLGGPFLKSAELLEVTNSLTASALSLSVLVADVFLSGILTLDQVSVLLTASWPFFPDLPAIVDVAAKQVQATMTEQQTQLAMLPTASALAVDIV